jgi:hypothetical protein
MSPSRLGTGSDGNTDPSVTDREAVSVRRTTPE